MQLGGIRRNPPRFIARQRLRAGRPEFRYIEVVFTTDARGKIHRQFVAALLDIHVVG
jgi:hypothetical protein